MNVRNQYWLHVVALFAGSVGFLLLAFYWSPYWLAAIPGVLLATCQGLMGLECELCGDPLLHYERRFGRRNITAWWLVLPRECQTCDHPVTETLELVPELELAAGLS
jgi:hypothetical protein